MICVTIMNVKAIMKLDHIPITARLTGHDNIRVLHL